MISRSKTENFEEAEYIFPEDFKRDIVLNDEITYLALISVPMGWSEFRPQLFFKDDESQSLKGQRVMVDLDQIHARFIEDMKDFAIRWDDDDTDALLNILPRSALQMPTFSTVRSIAEQSTLASRYSPSVVALRALLIHQFNYLKLNHFRDVPESIWSSMNMFVSCEDASDQFINCIAKGNENDHCVIKVDRHSAHRVILDGKGDRRQSIMHQVAMWFKTVRMEMLRSATKPWKVKFVDEEAIDASGPMRELMTECATSIFEKTSCLCFPVPNARHHRGQFKDLFVPYDETNGEYSDIYRGIGIYIGMVVRTGFVQDMPFVPFVWKFIAGGELSSNDILMVDKMLSDQFAQLRQAEADKDFQRCAVPWKIEQWNGQQAMLPGHSADSTVGPGEVENFIIECINFRINSIKPTLQLIRQGFIDNTKIDSHPLLTGARLSHMAQGSNVITTQQLRSITQVNDYKGLEDKNIRWFFNAVDRFNPDQRKLLLKFITTLTRLPNSSINSSFVLKIDKLERENPDQSLPTASTCFNRLHLPPYSSEEITYQKLLIAIQYCQTMENR